MIYLMVLQRFHGALGRPFWPDRTIGPSTSDVPTKRGGGAASPPRRNSNGAGASERLGGDASPYLFAVFVLFVANPLSLLPPRPPVQIRTDRF